MCLGMFTLSAYLSKGREGRDRERERERERAREIKVEIDGCMLHVYTINV